MTITYTFDKHELIKSIVFDLKQHKLVKRSFLISNILIGISILFLITGFLMQWNWCYVACLPLVGLIYYRPRFKKQVTKNVNESEQAGKLKYSTGLVNLTIERGGLVVTKGETKVMLPVESVMKITKGEFYIAIILTHDLFVIPLQTRETANKKKELIEAIDTLQQGKNEINPMAKEEYLSRINFKETITGDNKTLISLHEHHVMQIPFENLDVHYKRNFTLNFADVYKKVIINGRGGFCYELNFLFSKLLTESGFSNNIISARIFDESGTLGPEYDHMAICVKSDKEYLADVGFGDLFIKPLEVKDGVQTDGRNFFKIEKFDNDNYILLMRNGTDFQKKYIFNLNEVSIEKFKEPCLDKQINPDSYFVKNTICTKPTPSGRITLLNNKLIETSNGKREETIIIDDTDMREKLKSRFDILIN